MAPSTRPTIYREVTDRIIGELEQLSRLRRIEHHEIRIVTHPAKGLPHPIV